MIITKKARNDLFDCFYHSKVNIQNYVYDLIDYAEKISILPKMGKIVDYIEQYEIRQLIYQRHKILYIIFNNKIYILGFIHSSRNFKIQKNFNLIDFPELQ